MRIGRNITALRKEQGMLQDELARKAGISRGYLARIETEQGPKPHAKTLSRIAFALGVEISELEK